MTARLRQLSPEWFAARRSMVTASDVPVLLGLSPFTSEAELAARKLSGEEQPASLRMRIGVTLEPLIAEAYTERTGRKLRRFGSLAVHPEYAWAGASPDWRAKGRLVETKHTGSRSRFADGLPQDIEAQAVWQAGVTGYPVVDVAAVVVDSLEIFEVPAQPAVFADLLDVARDFLRRLEAGGPFAHNAASLRAAYPSDNGAEMVADVGLTEAIHELVDTRKARRDLETREQALETAVKGRMGEFARLVGPDFTVTWKRTKDIEEVDWKTVAAGLLRQMPETEREAYVGLYRTVRPGFRPFRVSIRGEKE
jgi:putative phage-type endonuclease